jgi:hypothetical protein
MIYDTMRSPPEPGSVLESLLVLVSKRRQEAQVGAVRLLAEAVLRPMKDSEKHLGEALESYLNSMFPYLAAKQSDKDISAKATLGNWVAKGPLKVRPLWQANKKRTTGLKSRIKERAHGIKRAKGVKLD